jgi:hypothetical protein
VDRLPETANEIPSQDNEVNKPQLHFHHSLDSVPKDTSLEQPPRHKDKRVKKRDMRGARDSSRRATSDTSTTDPKNPARSDVLAKKAKKKKQRAKQRNAEAVNAAIQPVPTPSPPRDPALDLVAGFHSKKVCPT